MTSFFLKGFNQEIKEKCFHYSAHIQILPYSLDNNPTAYEVDLSSEVLNSIKNLPEVSSVNSVLYQGVILKNHDKIEGQILKGITDVSKYKNFIIDGNISTLNNSDSINRIALSQQTARKLGVKVGEDILIAYLIGSDYSIDKFRVTALFKTSLEEFDLTYSLVHKTLIRERLHLDTMRSHTIEIMLHHYEDLHKTLPHIDTLVPDYQVLDIAQLYPSLFDWLHLMSQNEYIIWTIMLIVCIVNILSMIWILILDRVQMVGTLMAYGAQRKHIYSIFFQTTIMLQVFAFGLGFIFSLVFLWLQNSFHLIKLDEAIYYMSYAPMSFALDKVIYVFILSFVASWLAILVAVNLVLKNSITSLTKFE